MAGGTIASAVTSPPGIESRAGEDGVRLWAGGSSFKGLPGLASMPAGSGLHISRTWLDDPEGWRARLGATVARLDGETRFMAEGTEISAPLLGGRLYASQERRHWGPGRASLFLDAQAQPVAAVGWRREQALAPRTAWLRWLGPWTADLFFGTLQGHEAPRRPWLIGMRIELEPAQGFALGLTRTLLWGGRGRDEGLRSLLRALAGHDNAGDDGVDVHNQPGNQMAGVDLRYTGSWAGQGHWTVYGQIAGEDEAGQMPSRFLGLAGVSVGRGAWTGFAEWADTGMRHAYGEHQPGAYRHAVFSSGYTQWGRQLGHPVGGDVVLHTIGARLGGDSMEATVALHRGRALPGAMYFAPGERLNGLGLALSSTRGRPADGWAWGLAVQALRHGGRTERVLQVSVGHGL